MGGEIDTNAFDINYKADSNQMNFLQLASSSAEQTITFHCKDTVAHLNRAKNKRHAVSLMAWNDLEIKHRGKARYQVLSDECQHKKRSWAQTVFKVQSRKPARLPIVASKSKTLVAATRHSRLKWAKSASARNMLMAPQEVRACCDLVSQTDQGSESWISRPGNLGFLEARGLFQGRV